LYVLEDEPFHSLNLNPFSLAQVVPVLRNCETMSFADVEKAIGVLGRKARDVCGISVHPVRIR
jgi:hypothetical protein